MEAEFTAQALSASREQQKGADRIRA